MNQVTFNLNPVHDMKNPTPTFTQDNASFQTSTGLATPQSPSAARHTFSLGLDIGVNDLVAVIQCDHQLPGAARRFTRQSLLDYVRQLCAQGHTVATVYEACGFGYTLHHQLIGLGAQSLVTAPVRLSPDGRRRKTDKLDARQLCLRLSRYREGNRHELPVIRVPTVQEQRRREQGRQRAFLLKEVRRLENHGRALSLEHSDQTLPARWWGPRNWKRLSPKLDPWLREHLESLTELIRNFAGRASSLTAQLEASVHGQRLPKGLGALTTALLDGELCDWNRFHNRKQVGSYTGCCPGVYASSGLIRYGNIDKHGNPHVRTWLIEAVWRLIRYQPAWPAWNRMKSRLVLGAAVRKKTIVALARQLAIDLWRWRTGRSTLGQLGFLEMEAD